MRQQTQRSLNKHLEISKAEYLWLSSILAIGVVPLYTCYKRSSKTITQLSFLLFAGIIIGCLAALIFPLPLQYRVFPVIVVMLTNIFAAVSMMLRFHSEGDLEIVHTREYRWALIAVVIQILVIPILLFWQVLMC